MIGRVLNILRELWVMLGITLLFLVGMEIVARVGFGLRDVWSNRGLELVDPSLRADVFQGQEWAKGYWIEEGQTVQTSHAEWHSYVYWRRKPFQGKYINVDANGIRRTWNAAPVSTANQLKIAMFGGSALWGTGSRDEFTIPSQVAKKLKAKGMDAWVTNFGEGGYVSTQDVIALMLELQKGNVPDIVVFYDGANDTFSAVQQGIAGIPQNEYHRVWEFNQLNWRDGLEQLALYRFAAGLSRGRARATAPTSDSQLANNVVNVYLSNVKIVQSLAREYGFAVVFYWQPVLYTKKNLSSWEKQQVDASYGAAFFQQVNQVLNQNSSSRPANLYDLSSLFDGQTDSAFFDPFHTSETANGRVADFIVGTLPSATPRGDKPAH